MCSKNIIYVGKVHVLEPGSLNACEIGDYSFWRVYFYCILVLEIKSPHDAFAGYNLGHVEW